MPPSLGSPSAVGAQSQADRQEHAFFAADALIASVESGAIALLSGRWIIKLRKSGGRLKRRQDLPAEAFLGVDELRRLVKKLGNDWGLLLVAISYRWLTAEHPDPDGFHLAIIAQVAELYLDPPTGGPPAPMAGTSPALRTNSRRAAKHLSPLVEAFDRAGLCTKKIGEDGRELLYDCSAVEFGVLWEFGFLHKPPKRGKRKDKEA